MQLKAVVLTIAVALSASTAADAAQGQYATSLRTMLTKTAAGMCPADMMAASLLAACREQMPKMGPSLAALGPIKSMVLVGTETRKGEKFEHYRVTFAKGKAANWYIGALHDGKFAGVYSPEDL